MVPSSFFYVGRVWWVWVVPVFSSKWGGERESDKQEKSNFLFPASTCVGKKNMHSAV
jgi:hypothetical protein